MGNKEAVTEKTEEITTQAQTEQQLRQLQAAVEQSANTVVITNTQGYIEYANPKFVETTGYTLEEAIGQHTRMLKSGETSPQEYKQLWETISAGEQWHGEFHNRKKNGELYWESATISPIKNEAGEITHFLAVKEEITERKAAQEALAKRARELETAAQVSIATSTILDVDTLLQTVADLTKKNFNLYHAHIYLFDEADRYLLLAAGAAEIGRQMVAEGWRIPYDKQDSLVARAARRRQGVIVNDVRQDPGYFQNPLLPETRSELATPLIVGQDLLGVLDVQADQPDYFTQEDVRILTTLAAQVANAVQNARLFERVSQAQAKAERRLHETEILTAIEAALSQATTEIEILQAISMAFEAGQPPRLILNYFETDTPDRPEFFYPAAAWPEETGFAGAGPSIQHRGQITDLPLSELWLSQPNEVLFVADIFADPRVDPGVQTLAQEQGFRSLALLPLRSGNRWQGIVRLNWTEQHTVSRSERFILTQLLEPIAATVASRRAYLKQQEALAEAAGLYAASQRIIEADTLAEIVAAIAEGGPAPQIKQATLLTFDTQLAFMAAPVTVSATWSRDGEAGDDRRASWYDQANKLGLFGQEPLFVSDTTNDERLPAEVQATLQHNGVGALAILPLRMGNYRLGVIVLELANRYVFNERDTHLYFALARQIAVTLENRRLLQETRAALAEVEATQRRYTVQAWETYRAREKADSYQTVRDGEDLAGAELPAEIEQAVINKQTTVLSAGLPASDGQPQPRSSLIVAPLKVRDEVIGVLGLEEPDQARRWMPEEIALVEAVAEQMALAAEGLRLLDETQQRAAREQLTRRITDRIRSSSNIETALKTAVSELSQALGTTRATVELQLPEDGE